MIEKTGNMFDTNARGIGHGVNTFGVMGAGVAKIFRDKYPKNYQEYRKECASRRLKPGGLFVGVRDNHQIVYNMASQEQPGKDAHYHMLLSSAIAAMSHASVNKVDRIAIPEIGCGIGGLVWGEVKPLLQWVERNYGRDRCQWEVWTLPTNS